MTETSPEGAARAGRPFEVTNRMVVAITLPMTLAFITTPLIGLTDTAVVGQMGEAALIGGLAVGAIIFDIAFATFNFLRSATTGLVAQAFGRDDAREQQAVLWRSLLLAIAIGGAIILAGPLIVAGGLAFMAPGPEVAATTELYVHIRLLSSPAALANYAILGFVLGRGEAKTGLGLQVVINGGNIVLSIVFGLWMGWGVAGVAWATVLAEFIGAGVGLLVVRSRFSGRPPDWEHVFRRSGIMRLLSLNRDIMLRSMALLVAVAFFTRSGVQFGPTVLAANAILLNFFFVAAYYLDGLATAAEQIVGRAIGAGYRPAFERAFRLTIFWDYVLCAAAAGLLLFAGPFFIDLMTTAEDVRQAARGYLFWAALCVVSGVLAFLMDGVFIGATWSRDMRNMMVLSLAFYLVLIFTVVPEFGNHGLWLAYNLFLGIRGITLLALVGSRADATFPSATLRD